MNTGIDFYYQIKEIESASPQKIKAGTEKTSFVLRPEKWLLENLSGNYGALFIRAILHHLNIDESYVLKWRLENKYKQYQILNYYAPNCMPATLPLSTFLNEKDGIKNVRLLFSEGYFLKATLGDGSYNTQTWDKTGEFEHIVLSPSKICTGQYENYMLQKKISIKTEFRVHTFFKDIIPGLSYVSNGDSQNDKQGLKGFINEVLNKMPDSILTGTLIAWDIAITTDNVYYVIEANFTGYHPEYRKGFQTTGYVDDQKYGPIICAWLNIYFDEYFGVHADRIGTSLLLNFPFYKALEFYMPLFKKEHLNLVRNNANHGGYPVIIYLGEDTNYLMINLIKHFLLVDFAYQYHVIVKDKSTRAIFSLFAYTRGKVLLHQESELFTNEQFDLIEQLSRHRRKQICCYHLLRKVNNGIII